MTQAKEALSHNVTLSRRSFIDREVPTREVSRNAEGNSKLVRKSLRWQTMSLVCLTLLLATTVGIAFYSFERVNDVNMRLESTMGQVERKIQMLDAGISFESKRRYLTLGIRDEIIQTNPVVSLNEAYDYAHLVLKASEKYPSLDPLLLVAVGIVESRYDKFATSTADARGLYQIWPSTGRLLARSLGWVYSNDILYDPEKNTEMAALYLDILFSAYNDEKMVLAEYNGGPVNAGYLRAKSKRVAAETRDYVSKVLNVYDRLQLKFNRGFDGRLTLMHNDIARDGKILGASLYPRRPDDLPPVDSSAKKRETEGAR